MRLAFLTWMINEALIRPIPKELSKFCGKWYSPYYNLFYLLAERHKGTFVELGVDKGRGSFAFVLGGCDAVGIDHTRNDDIGILDNKFPNFVFLETNTLPVPEQIKELKIDFLHIDTEHSYSMAKAEFEAYQPYLNSPAIVFFDDLHAQEDSVLKYFNELPYQKIQEDKLHPVDGFGVVLYE